MIVETSLEEEKGNDEIKGILIKLCCGCIFWRETERKLKMTEDSETEQSYLINRQLVRFFGRLLFFAILLGLVNSTIVRIFQVTLEFIWEWLQVALLNPYPSLLVIAPGVGGLLAGTLIYNRCPEASGEGVPLYIKNVNKNQGKFPSFVGLNKFFAAVFVMGFRGSGGFVGPVVAMNAHAGAWVHRQVGKILSGPLGLSKGNYRRGAICGVAAALGALFKIPLGGGVFAVEILSPTKLYYNSLFPAVLASTAGTLFYNGLYDASPVFPVELELEMSWLLLVGIFLTSLLAGVVGLFFVRSYNKIADFFENLEISRRYLPMIGGLLAGVVGLIIGRETLGTGHTLINGLINNQVLIFAAVMFLIGRVFTTSFTIGSGGSAGFTFPAILMGFLCGYIISGLIGPLGRPDHVALLVTGMAGLLACVMNIPLAAIIISMELFGISFALPAVAGSLISFHLGRSEIIYEYREQTYDLG